MTNSQNLSDLLGQKTKTLISVRNLLAVGKVSKPERIELQQIINNIKKDDALLQQIKKDLVEAEKERDAFQQIQEELDRVQQRFNESRKASEESLRWLTSLKQALDQELATEDKLEQLLKEFYDDDDEKSKLAEQEYLMQKCIQEEME